MRLLFCIAFLSLMSCSGDDNTEPVNTNPIAEEPEGKDLLSKVSINESYKYVVNYEDNKIKDSYTYNLSGELLYFFKYTYLNNGTIGEIKYFDAQGNFTGTSDAFLYDGEGKLVQVVMKALDEEGEVYNYMDFTYNPDGTVTREYDFGGLTTTVYSFNSLGQLYMINEDGYESIATYEGNTIISRYSGNLLTTFTYDNTTSVKGHLLKTEFNMFNGHYQNTALYFAFSPALMSPDKFMIESSNENGYETQSTYEFDEDGYPIKITGFQNGELYSTTVISYQ